MRVAKHSKAGVVSSMSNVVDLPERLEFLQGTLEVLILRSLQMAQNHAYGIMQFLKQQWNGEFIVDNGSLYPALQSWGSEDGCKRNGKLRRMAGVPGTTS